MNRKQKRVLKEANKFLNGEQSEVQHSVAAERHIVALLVLQVELLNELIERKKDDPKPTRPKQKTNLSNVQGSDIQGGSKGKAKRDGQPDVLRRGNNSDPHPA